MGGEGAVLTYPAHKAVLSSRSYYLKGYVLAAETEGQVGGETGARVSLAISSEHANADTMKELMEYIYMDKTPAATTSRQQRGHLLSLARELGLHALCMRMQSSGPYITEQSSRSGQQLVGHSTYVRDMEELLHSGLHADLMFTASPSLLGDQPDLPGNESSKVILVFHCERGDF